MCIIKFSLQGPCKACGSRGDSCGRPSEVLQDLRECLHEFWESLREPCPDLLTKNTNEIENAIEKVFKSYGKHNQNQFILVQEYIQNAESVGVIFTADPKNGSPFRTVNFNNSNSTDLITSGKSNGQIIYYFKNILESKIKALFSLNPMCLFKTSSLFSF